MRTSSTPSRSRRAGPTSFATTTAPATGRSWETWSRWWRDGRGSPRRSCAGATEQAREEDPDRWEDTQAYRLANADYERVSRQEKAYRERPERFSIKFRDPRFLAVADYHYIMAPRGLIRRHEVPPRWGLLDATPSVVVPAPHKDIRKNVGIVSNVLRAIARANAASMMRHHGVTFQEGEDMFPRE